MWHSRLNLLVLYIFPFPNNTYVPFYVSPTISIKATNYILQNQALLLPLLLISFFLCFDLTSFHLLMVLTTMLFLLIITQSINGITPYVGNLMLIPPLSRSTNFLKTILPPLLKHFTQIMGVNFEPFRLLLQPMV